jgi:hypothetical protein
MQQFAHLCQIGSTHRVGKQSIVTDTMEAAGQDMEQEAAHEFASFESHGLVAGTPLGTVVLPAERHAAFIEGDETLVPDAVPVLHGAIIDVVWAADFGWCGVELRGLGPDTGRTDRQQGIKLTLQPFIESDFHSIAQVSPWVGYFLRCFGHAGIHTA